MSFSIANSGLNALSRQLSAISNNIANSDTVGYKSMRAEFSSLYAGNQPLGVGVERIAQSISQSGNLVGAAGDLDLAISGGGFFITKDSAGNTSYTRAGYFQQDNQGYLINNAGKRVQGYPVDASGQLQTGMLGDLMIGSGTIPAKVSDRMTFIANLSADMPALDDRRFDRGDSQTYNHVFRTPIYDSLGRQHSLEQYFVKTDEGKWQAHYFIDGNATEPASQSFTFDVNGLMTQPDGKLQIKYSPAGAGALSIDADYTGTTQFASDFSVTANNANGYTSGERNGRQVDADGKIYATYSNGQRLLQGQLVLANFTNPDGLESTDGTAWTMTNQSGQPLLGTPQTGSNGSIKSSMLEQSNVDITSELMGLMAAQRNYQANTKVISTNDQMMTALFQAL